MQTIYRVEYTDGHGTEAGTSKRHDSEEAAREEARETTQRRPFPQLIAEVRGCGSPAEGIFTVARYASGREMPV